ncbi:putative cytochrome b561 and DOMON domain-containing protein [Helianthus annuus]|uniref:Cytochrome b561 and DOMON domain-containing protein n=1 Tax=Helianthus annuus TaxID=4232 RepID=A0A251RZW3_HELAN|nr:cytochrome b561 and DOMON domain-containing protein At5g47530 [Helianthus annuus]KAF5760550.1 putative cytochrome b561 and DOMON domain-containing protein [Helianthus annuus]KAJ0821714.1 putative cytochrome b561 and DOMON domain-containing protein [Helianthus annuus]
MGLDVKMVSVCCTMVLTTMFLSTYAQICSNYAFANNAVFSSCNDLPVLNSFLHYTYNPSSQTLAIAYRHTNFDSSKWVAWGINPTSQGMAGTQALVAFQQSDGSMKVYTSPITGYATQLAEGDLSFPVSDLSSTFSNNEIVIFATLGLQNGTGATMNQVWQEGQLSGNAPTAHATSGDNIRSMGTVNVLSGQSGSAGGASGTSSKTTKRNIHGVLNAISWGIMMPLGAIIARYLRVFPSADPAWFYLHVTCQTSAYVIGVSGWATGIRLGSQSPGIQFTAHRVIGIILFCVATLQVIALLVRPKKEHKHRIFWNIYHHSLGYSIIILGIINIFKGFDILNPEKKWERAYTGIIIILAIVAAILEAYTWLVVLKRKKAANAEKMTNGNGYANNGHYPYSGMTGRV